MGTIRYTRHTRLCRWGVVTGGLSGGSGAACAGAHDATSSAGTADIMAGAAFASVACVPRFSVAGSCSAVARAWGGGAAEVVCGRTKNEAIVVALVTRDAPADRVGTAGFSDATTAFWPQKWTARAQPLCVYSMLPLLFSCTLGRYRYYSIMRYPPTRVISVLSFLEIRMGPG